MEIALHYVSLIMHRHVQCSVVSLIAKSVAVF